MDEKHVYFRVALLLFLPPHYLFLSFQGIFIILSLQAVEYLNASYEM